MIISLFFTSVLSSYSETINYVYDELNRLKRVEYEDGTIVEYTYDEAGNRSHVYVGKYTLSINVVGNGTVTKNPDQPIYSLGTNVTLTAVNGAETFSEWSGDLTGNTNPTTIVMDGNKSVTATFGTGKGWLQGWTYRKPVTLSRASGGVTNYQMQLLVGETSGASGEDVDCNGHVQADFDDLRFTTSDGTTLLDYWIESITGTTPNQLATVWIKFNSIGTDATTFYMYYGKTDATAVSSITATFLAGDDGVSGNFTEAKSGSATITHTSGKYNPN
jgi:YD repeat-containing protein